MSSTDTDFLPKMKAMKPQKKEEGWIPLDSGNRMVTERYHNGEIIEGYKIVRTVSSGNMGIVYLCENMNDNLLYIMKTLVPNESTKENMQRIYEEAKRMVNIPMHPNVARIQTYFTLNDVPHLILIYAQGVYEEGSYFGSSLRDLINKHWKFDFLDILWIAEAVCSGMAHCQKHIKGFVHGDIKPENILLHPLEVSLEWGLTKYQVMVSDFGGGKTRGYYVSEADKPADAEDDIYAFAKVMEELFAEAYKCGNMDGAVYWDRFADGLQMMLHEPYSSNLRRDLDFRSLYNGYAEAMEFVLGLNSMGYVAEDILPKRDESIRTQIIEELNSCLRRWNLGTEDKGEIVASMHHLLEKPGVERVYLDDLPVAVLIQFRLAEFYFSNRQWEMFDSFMREIKAFLTEHGSVSYQGMFRYSAELETDAGILEQLSNMIRNREVDTNILICAIRPNVDVREWLEDLFYYIKTKDREKLPKLQEQMVDMAKPDETYGEKIKSYYWIMGSFYWSFEQRTQACPYYKYLVETDRNCILYSYRYGICLYEKGCILQSMMYFEHVYDIYKVGGSYQNENFNEVQMGLISLSYLCDFACSEGHCRMLLLLRGAMLSESERKWVNRLIEDSSKCQEIMREWHWLLGAMKIRNDDRPDISMLKQKKEEFYKILKLKRMSEVMPYHRAVFQRYYESCWELAEFYLKEKEYDCAIQECDDILEFDCTNFGGYRIRGTSYMELWKKTGEDAYRINAIQDMEEALKYVYMFFPVPGGVKSTQAKQWEAWIRENIMLLKRNSK